MADPSDPPAEFGLISLEEIRCICKSIVDGGYQRIGVQTSDNFLDYTVAHLITSLEKGIDDIIQQRTEEKKSQTISVSESKTGERVASQCINNGPPRVNNTTGKEGRDISPSPVDRRTSPKIDGKPADQSSGMIPVRPNLFILADTCYGECCVDEVSAQHYMSGTGRRGRYLALKSDCIIHVGPFCGSLTSNSTPVIYIFPRKAFLASHFQAQLIDFPQLFINSSPMANSSEGPSRAAPPSCLDAEGHTICIYDADYHHSLGGIVESLAHQLVESQLRAVGGKNDQRNSNTRSLIIAVPRTSQGCRPNSDNKLFDGLTKSADGLYSLEINNSENHLFMGRTLFKVEVSSGGDGSSYTLIKLDHNVYGGYWDWMDPKKDKLLYIGHLESSSPLYHRLSLRFLSKFEIYAYDPSSSSSDAAGISRPPPSLHNTFYMQRFGYMDRVKESSRVIGLVHGTVSVRGHREVTRRLIDLCRFSDRLVISIVVGKMNVPKLENFPEVDVFCLVGCPESSLIDSKDYSKPILTPFELEIALGAREWTPEYILDFEELIQLPIPAPQSREEMENREESRRTSSCERVGVTTADINVYNRSNQLMFSSFKELMDSLTSIESREFQGVQMFEGELHNTASKQEDRYVIQTGDAGIASQYIKELGKD